MNELVHVWLGAIVRPAILPLALAAVPLTAVPASAQEFPAREVGGWMVAASKDKEGCFITRTYEGNGETTLLLGLNVEGGNHLTVLNENWSIKPKTQLKLSFRLSKGGYSNQSVVGMASEGKKGFVTSFEAKFPSYFAASKALHIYRGDVPVEQLSLDGSGAAVAELRRCVGVIGAKTVTGDPAQERSRRIPKDPFATGD